MKIYRLVDLSPEEYSRLLRRSEIDIAQYAPLAREVIERVRRDGDSALLYFTEKFDRITLEKNNFG